MPSPTPPDERTPDTLSDGLPRTIVAGASAPDDVAFDATIAPRSSESLEPPSGGPSLPADGPRYELRDRLGQGGMGTVDLCRDRVIGRDVALKRLHTGARGTVSVSATERFLREARVQGQLEHPAIVPVYDLGATPDGRAYFTMKRVRGEALDDLLGRIADGDPDTTGRYTLRRLLAAFSTVCLAVDFAHSRGVLHRDLKPANVMLGEFGEVNVLDWGLAKVRRDLASHEIDANGIVDVTDSVEGRTLAGSLLGTPGYMSPEQIEGRIDALDARTDVYALGAILFEILHLEPLHDGATVSARIASTLSGEGALRARARSKDVPPELDRLWRAAVAHDLAARIPSARALADAVERYLDGQRDEARRRELALAHVEEARRANASTSEGRAEALRALGRALALDPTHAEALATLSSLLTALPPGVPPPAARTLADARDRRLEELVRATSLRFAVWTLVVPLTVAGGVRDGALVAILLGWLVASALYARWLSLRGTPDTTALRALVVVSSVATGLVSLALGPLVVAPGLAATFAVFFMLGVEPAHRPWVIAGSLSAFLVPYALLVVGAVDTPYMFTPAGELVIRSPMAVLTPASTHAALLVTSLASVLVPARIASAIRDRLAAAEERVVVQAHYLSELVPPAARAQTAPRKP